MIKNFIANIVNKEILPEEVSDLITKFWEEQNKINPKLFNGPVFGVENIILENDFIRISLFQSDFAHFLYTQKVSDLGKYNLVNIYCSVVVKTNDDFFVLGKMNKHTAFPGLIQFCGGGLDPLDIIDGKPNFEHAIKREIAEELYISDTTPVFENVFEFEGEHKVAVLFSMNSPLKKEEFLHHFEKNKESDSEFEELVFVKNNAQSKEFFVSSHSTEILVKSLFQKI